MEADPGCQTVRITVVENRACRGAACNSRQRCAPPLADLECKPGGIRGIWRGKLRYELSFSGGQCPLIWLIQGIFAPGLGAHGSLRLCKSLPAILLSQTCRLHVLESVEQKTRSMGSATSRTLLCESGGHLHCVSLAPPSRLTEPAWERSRTVRLPSHTSIWKMPPKTAAGQRCQVLCPRSHPPKR